MSKKAFSLMEVIIAIVMLSVVMIALLQIKSDNIFLIKSSDEKAKLNDYILMATNFDEVGKRNDNLFLDKNFRFDNDELRTEFKDKKIKIKDEKEETTSIDNEYMKVNITTFSTSYSLEEKMTKKIYSFKIEL